MRDSPELEKGLEDQSVHGTAYLEAVPLDTEISEDGQPVNLLHGQVDKWTAYRMTCGHDNAEAMRKIFSRTSCVLAKETSSKGVEHFHALTAEARSVGICKALQRFFKGQKANKYWSLEYPNEKNPGSTFVKGISYTIKGKDYECYDGFHRYLEGVPEWKFKEQTDMYKYGKSDKDDDPKEKDWQLNYSNLVCQAVQHAKRTKQTDLGLKTIVKDMMHKTKWRPSRDMYKNGVPDVYDNDFQFRLGKRKEMDMSWWIPRSFT